MGRDRSDLRLLREACSEMKVEVSDEYRDPILRKGVRDVLVLPSLREVWVYSDARRDKVVKLL